ncbi:MAG: polyamine aminopropyltransferase [Alphaproteobacteria bacterium]|nr:polyamine aminopropyltransferase [Alphaproteobacteria bacterium]
MIPKYCFKDDEGQLWFKESLTPSVGNALRVDALVHSDESDLQHLILFDNETHGRVLAIDGLVQVSLSDEFIYHEMVTHVPLLAHGSVKSVLVVGGGDGGAMREILRHSSVERVVLAEIDKDVIDFSREWLPTVSDGSFDDPRVEIKIVDGVDYMRTGEETFDLIIIDSSDPVGPSAVLFTEEFYRDCHKRLAPGGMLVTQSGLAAIHSDVVENTSEYFARIFKHHGFYAITVPTFSGGVMTLGFASDNAETLAPADGAIEARFERSGLQTRYYSPAVHRGAFALPRYLDALLTR